MGLSCQGRSRGLNASTSSPSSTGCTPAPESDGTATPATASASRPVDAVFTDAAPASVPSSASIPPVVATSASSPPAARKRAGRTAGRGFVPAIRVTGQFLELSGVLIEPGRRRGVGRPPSLQVSVPKRLVRSAVRRNTVKRVLREAWRQRWLATGPLAAAPDAEGAGTEATGTLADPALSGWADRSWRFRLKAHPLGKLVARSQFARAQMRRQARAALMKKRSLAGGVLSVGSADPAVRRASRQASGKPMSAADGDAIRLPGLMMVKRQLRAEADRLLAEAGQRLQKPDRKAAAGRRQSEERSTEGRPVRSAHAVAETVTAGPVVAGTAQALAAGLMVADDADRAGQPALPPAPSSAATARKQR